MTRPIVLKPWMLGARLLLLLCVWPLVTTADNLARQRPVPRGPWTIRPSADGCLLWIKGYSTGGREAYAEFNWETGGLRTCERRDTAFDELDHQAGTRGVIFSRPLARMDRDAKNARALISDGKRTFVVDERTGNELFVIPASYVVGRFIPSTSELVYLSSSQRLCRISLPSGQVAAMHAPWEDYRPIAAAWSVAAGCWFGGWLLLLAVGGGVWWLDIAALSLSAMVLSSAFHQPLFDRDHQHLMIGLLASLALVSGLVAGSLQVSRAIIASVAIIMGATLALGLYFAVNSEPVAKLAVALILLSGFMCIATLWRRSTGWHITQLAADQCGVRPPRPPASLLHIFVLTASCAFLFMVAGQLGVTSAYWNQRAFIETTNIPLLGTLVGCMATSAGLAPKRWKWILLTLYAAAVWFVLAVLPVASGLSLTGILWPGTRATLGLAYPTWFALFAALWMYVLRSSGLRMRRYALPEPPDPFA